MNIEINNNSQNLPCIIDSVSYIDEGKFKEFVNTLERSNYLDRLSNKTSLKWLEPSLKIKYSKDAEFEGLDTVLVDYNRGVRAVSSTIHESFHLMLRQIKWLENDTVKGMLNKYPELSTSSRGVGYKMEQMFAYLLQNEIFKDISNDLKFDASEYYWNRDWFMDSVIPREFNTSFLEHLSTTIIDVWYSSNRSNDIFEIIKEVDRRM